MSLSKKIAALVLLAAAIPNRAQTTDITDLDVEIKVEPSSNIEVLIEHQGFLDSDYEPAVITLENLQDLKEKEGFDDGYSLDADDDDENEENMECDCHDDQDGQHEVNDYNDNADYDEIFVESEEENQGDYQKMQPIYEAPDDAQAENMECNCHADQGDEDDYEADYGTVSIESEVEDAKEDQRDENQQQVFLPDTDDFDENEDFDCDCNDDQGDQDDEDDYDADYDTVFVESEGDEAVKNVDESPVEKKQPNLRAPVDQDAQYGVTKTLEDGEEVMVLVTYDQIMATLTEEEKGAEIATGEPFYKRMYDLIIGKETQKELEEHHILSREKRAFYDGL